MEQYIKKSDLVAEIKERIETYNKGYANGDDKRSDALEVLLHDIANFEVKEMKEEPVSEKWIEELTTKLDSMSKEDFKKVFDKYAIDFNEEPTSVELEKAANEWNAKASFNPFYMALDDNGKPNGVRKDYTTHAESFKAGAKWQKEHSWKLADGDDLPEIGREVIALKGIIDLTATDCCCEYEVVFAHRPDPKGYIGKSIVTGEVEQYLPKIYGKGGWNMPNITYWLDVELPKRNIL